MKKELELLIKYLLRVPPWLWEGIRRKPFEWVAADGGDNSTDYVEPWNKQVWMAVRPRYWGLMKKLPCGCSKRLGRFVLYNMRCKEHGLDILTHDED